MVFTYDMRSPYDSGRQVPLHVAQQLAEQRRQLLAEVQKLRRENDRLKATVVALREEQKTLQRRADEAEDVADELRHYLRERQSSQEKPTQMQERATEQISRLSRRVQELTGDLERVQQRSSDQLASARRQERSRLLSGLGDVLDSIDRGLQAEASGPWRQGLEAIRDQLLAFFRAEGARLTGEPGEKMDPHVHQALASVDDPDAQPGHIISVERQGIELEDGTIVRPAQVVVAR